MNMAITSTSAPTGKTTVATSGTAAGATSGSGFAGALVQAIDGSSNTSTVSNGLPLPIGLTSLLGQLGLETTGEQSEQLLDMLAGLVDQLDQLENSDIALSSEQQEQLAALLAAFQQLLQQLGQSQLADSAESVAMTTIVQNASETEDESNSKPVVKALRETLQQLSNAIASGKDGVQAATNFANQLKAILEPIIAAQTSNAARGNQVANDRSSNVEPIAKADQTSAGAANVPKEAMTQTAVVVQEQRRPAQALRDPVWRFNVDGTANSTSTNNQNAVVPTVALAEEANQSNSSPAWTFMQNDALSNTDATTSTKAAVPAQVPVQQFAEQMSKFLVKQFQLTQGNGISEAKISLTPEHLGQVDIRIVMQNGQLTAQFMTDNPMARDLLDNQMSQLRLALNGQGLNVERLEVVQQPSANANPSFMQQDQRHSNSGNGNGSNGKGNGDSFEDPAAFAAELERNSSLKEFGYGSSLNVTA